MRERVFTHVSTRLRKAAFPLPLVLLFLKTARFEKQLVVFSRKVPLFLTTHHKFQNSQVFLRTFSGLCG